MLDAFGVVARFGSLHSADPGDTGVDEVAGPVYGRRLLSWAAASAGTVRSSTDTVFDVPPGSVSFLGYWSAAVGGTFYGCRRLDARQVFATPGTFTLPAGAVVEELT